jgi:hypothetical protein
MIIMDYLKEKVSDVSDSILCFDGIMIRREKFHESFMADLETISAGLEIPMKLSVKAMKPIDLETLGFDPHDRYTFGDVASGPCLDAFNEFELDEEKLSKQLADAKEKDRSGIVCGEILALLKLLPSELIRSEDQVTSYDIVSRDVFTLREISMLIKQVFVYVYNNGDSSSSRNQPRPFGSRMAMLRRCSM